MHPIGKIKSVLKQAPVSSRRGCSILMILIWVLCGKANYAQRTGNPEFRKRIFTSGNGLCNSNVRALSKDKEGYLWIGTANGLSRFDGHFFTNFFHTPGDSNSLGHNFIQGILCDKQGNIWILHVLGLSKFSNATQTFTNYPLQQNYPHFSGGNYGLSADINGNIWIGNQNGLAVFHTGKRHFLDLKQLDQYLFIQQNELGGSGINGMVKGEKGQMWFNSYNSLFTWDPVKKQIQKINGESITGSNSSLAINHVDTLKKVVYIGTFNKGLILYNYQSRKWKQLRTGPESLSTGTYDPVRCLQPLSDSLYAYISELGIGFYNDKDGKLFPMLPVPFSNDRVMLCMITDSNNIWAGTDNGLFLLTHEKIIPENITPENRNRGAFNTIQVHQVQPVVFSGNYSLPVIYSIHSSGGLKQDITGISGYLRYFFSARNGDEWLSTEESIFYKKLNTKTWQKVPVELSKKPLNSPLPRNFAEDQNGNIWVRIRNAGLCRFDPVKQVFIQYPSPDLPVNSIYSGLYFSPSANTLWLSEENTGLHALSLETQKWEYHPLKIGNTPLTPARIVPGNNGCIAFPDPFNGIGIYFPGQRKLKLVSQKDGLLSNNVSTIDADTAGNFWTYSTEGISKIVANDFSVANYQHPTLVKMQEIACGRDGMVYIAAAEGLYRLNGNLLQPQKPSGKLIINKVEVMGIPYPFAGKMILPPGNSDIQVQFSYIDLYSGRQPSFEYRLSTNNEWKSLGKSNTITFSRLSPGDYTIFIREKHNINGEHWQTLSFTIERPFWQRGWFLVSIILLAGAGIYFFTQRRISSIREKASLQQKMAETEMAALRAQMNPHFIFNSINCIDAMVQEGDKYNATTYLNKFAKLIRNVLEGSRENTVPLSTDLETLRLYIELECMRMDYGFTWQISIGNEITTSDIRVPSLIIQPYVENAILHGIRHLINRKGELNIEVELKNDVLFYTIRDNGVGRVFSSNFRKTQYSSYGMDITKSRIEQFNIKNKGSVEIIDLNEPAGQPAGTEVRVRLPLA